MATTDHLQQQQIEYQCMGGMTPADLTQVQRDALQRIVQNTPGLLALHVYPNLDCESDIDNLPTGLVLYMDPAAKVDASLIHDRLFENLCVSRVLKGPYTAPNEAADDRVFLENRERMFAAVPQQSPAPPDAKVRDGQTLRELQPWTSELGGVGSFMGAYSQLADNHRDKTYFLAARGTVPHIVQDLKRQVQRDQPTWRQLVSEKQWAGKLHNGQYMANRNTQRNIAAMADESQVAVRRIRDLGARLPSADHAPPVRAEPEWRQVSHSIRDALLDRRPCVAIYSGVVPVADRARTIRQSDNHLFVASNPYDGLVVFTISREAAPTMAAAGAMPADSGLNPKRKPASAPENAKEIAARAAQTVHWEQRDAHPLHSDVAPDAHRSAQSAPLKQVMREAGWDAERGTRLLVPVAVKIYNPKI